MKAQAWLGLMAYKEVRDVSETIKSKSEFEGESARLHGFIKNLKSEELQSIGMRVIEDMRKLHQDDDEINAIWKKGADYLVTNSKFELDNYSDISFYDAMAKMNDSIAKIDTTSVTEEVKKESKYDRIKKKKGKIDPLDLDSSYYYRFNLSDLVQNESFLEIHDKVKKQIRENEKEQERIDKMGRREFKEYEKNKQSYQTDLTSFILVEPTGQRYKRSGKIKHFKSEELQEDYRIASINAGKSLNLKVSSVSKSDMATGGTATFNDKCMFTSFLQQISRNDEVNVFPVDYSYINNARKKYGTNKLVFSIVEHAYDPRFSSGDVYSILFPLIIPYRVVNILVSGFKTEINLIVLDMKTAEVESGINRTTKDPVSQM